MKITHISTLLIFTFLRLYAQSGTLDRYIREGLANNLALKQKEINIQRAGEALKEARGLFFPSIDFQSDYNLADGGRKIDFPAGDMLNPVYGTLNKLTQSNNFPQIQNQHIQLLPDDYHDTRVEVRMPLFNASIWYNKKIKEEAVTMKEAERDTYKRELIKEIKTAYFNYLKSVMSESIYKNASALLNENYKLTEALIKNNMALKSSLLKISAEIKKNDALLTESSNNSKNAASYVNFLLNRQTDSELEADTSLTGLPVSSTDNSLPLSPAPREELAVIKSGIVQNGYSRGIISGENIPSVGLFCAAGFQGTKYKFNSDQRYYLFGVQLKWNLFNGFGTTARKEQADLNAGLIKLQFEEAEKQFSLQISAAKRNLSTAIEKTKSAKANLDFSQEYYRQTRLRYASGQALLIELTDALTQLTTNTILYQTSAVDIYIKQAELERAAATSNL